MSALAAAVAGLVGLLFGSFANVVIHRVPRGESVVSPPSACPACATPIAARDNVPLLGWLLLRGRCRACGTRIAWRYPATAGLSARTRSFRLSRSRHQRGAGSVSVLLLVRPVGARVFLRATRRRGG